VNNRISRLLLLGASLVLLLCAAGCSAPQFTGSGAGEQDLAMASEVIHWVNVERQNVGLPALTNNAPLAKVAYLHSKDMLARDFFDHVNPNGAGINFSAVGENVGKGFLSAQEAVTEWMGSPPHRANILDPEFTQIGVGVVVSSDDPNLTRWTQLFRTP
jgi:uncharacterized protein YkwD